VDARGAERAADFLDGTLALDDHQFVRRKPDRVVDVARARHATLRPRPAHVLPKLTRVVAIDVAPDLFACHAMVIVCKDVPHVVEVIGNVFEARDSSSSQHALSRGRPLELIAEVASIRRRMHAVRRRIEAQIVNRQHAVPPRAQAGVRAPIDRVLENPEHAGRFAMLPGQVSVIGTQVATRDEH
jgi:hypothetical protein